MAAHGIAERAAHPAGCGHSTAVKVTDGEGRAERTTGYLIDALPPETSEPIGIQQEIQNGSVE